MTIETAPEITRKDLIIDGEKRSRSNLIRALQKIDAVDPEVSDNVLSAMKEFRTQRFAYVFIDSLQTVLPAQEAIKNIRADALWHGAKYLLIQKNLDLAQTVACLQAGFANERQRFLEIEMKRNILNCNSLTFVGSECDGEIAHLEDRVRHVHHVQSAYRSSVMDQSCFFERLQQRFFIDGSLQYGCYAERVHPIVHLAGRIEQRDVDIRRYFRLCIFHLVNDAFKSDNVESRREYDFFRQVLLVIDQRIETGDRFRDCVMLRKQRGERPAVSFVSIRDNEALSSRFIFFPVEQR